jgi:hypothetical protein
VLVVLAVARALLGATRACRPARLEHGPCDPGIARRLARDDTAYSHTHVGAVQAQPDAANHLADVGLGQIGVRTDRAGGGARQARLNAARDHVEGARLSHRQNCESMQRVHISPALGKRKADAAKTDDIERLARALLAKGLTPKTVRNTTAFMHSVFALAVRKGWAQATR